MVRTRGVEYSDIIEGAVDVVSTQRIIVSLLIKSQPLLLEIKRCDIPWLHRHRTADPQQVTCLGRKESCVI